jgi:malonyl-CoA/methylmalonyl-CoA synthetase
MVDRTDYVPTHGANDGNTLPANPLFARLLDLAHSSLGNAVPAIRDIPAGLEKSVAELLSDVLALRHIIRKSLPRETVEDIDQGKEIWISLYAPGGYEFAVGFLAVLALGAAVSPFSLSQPVGAALYYVRKANSVAILAATTALGLCTALAEEIQGTEFACIPISMYNEGPHYLPSDILISSNKFQDPNLAAIVIFTSGTTGPPKGAVLRRTGLVDGAMMIASQLRIERSDTVLHLLPVHHVTGIWIAFLPILQTGGCIEFNPRSFDPRWTWERFRKGGLTHFTGVPTIYMRMMGYYQEHLLHLPISERRAYSMAASPFKLLTCGTSALPKPLDDFWAGLMNGRRICQRYGSTELGVVFHMPFVSDDDIPAGSAGRAAAGIDVKLSDGQVLLYVLQVSA